MAVGEPSTWWSSASTFSFRRPSVPSLGTGPAGLLRVTCCCDQKRPSDASGDWAPSAGANLLASARGAPVVSVTWASLLVAMPDVHNTGSPVGQTGASPDHCLRSLTDIAISLSAVGHLQRVAGEVSSCQTMSACLPACLRARGSEGESAWPVWGPELGTSAWCTRWPRGVGVDEEHASDESASFKDWTRRRSGAWKG